MEAAMYVIVQHRINDPEVAFARGARLVRNEGAPDGVRGLQFFPSRDGSAVTCLWEAGSVESVQDYVDTTLGDSSDNLCYEIDASQSFAALPAGVAPSPHATTA
jgi:hypothetical protein